MAKSLEEEMQGVVYKETIVLGTKRRIVKG